MDERFPCGLEHACFISFSGGIGTDTKFARYFYEELAASLGGLNKTLKVFKFDLPECERRRNADHWPLWIQRELCRSAMMFAVCAPNYFNGSDGCVSEFRGMCDLASLRERALGMTPKEKWIQALRLGDEGGMTALDADCVAVHDFPDAFEVPWKVKSAPKYKRLVYELAKSVRDHWDWLHEQGQQRRLADLACCGEFRLPSEPRARSDRFPHFEGVR